MSLVKMSDLQSGQSSTSKSSDLVPMGQVSQPVQTTVQQSPDINSFGGVGSDSYGPIAPEASPINNELPGGWLNPINDWRNLNESFNKTGIGRFINQIGNSAGNIMGLQDKQMAPATPSGNKIVDTISKVIGQGVGYLTNPSQLEQNVGNVFFGNSIVQNAGSKVGSLLESKLSRNALGRAAANAEKQATIGALGSVAYAPFQTLISGQDVQNIPRNVLEQGLIGAVLGGAGGALGSLAKSGLKSMKDVIGGMKEPVLPDYSNAKLSTGTDYKSTDEILNSNAKNSELIKLTPDEIARNERIEKFSRVEENPQIPNTADQIQSKTGKESIPFLTQANEAYIKGVDNLHRLNQFDQVAKDANAGELKPSDSAYMLALNARGHDMQASQIVNRNMIDSQGNVTGQSLADMVKQIPKGKEQAFNDYVVAKDSIARMGRGEEVYAKDKNMTIQKAQIIVDQYDKTDPTFKDVASQYTQFHKDFAQNWYVDTGLFSPSQMEAANVARPDYVPNKRIFSDLEKKQQFNSKGGIAGQTNPVKHAPGSQRPIVSPIESSIEDVAKGVKTAKQNEAGQAIVRSLIRNPEELSGFAEIDHGAPTIDVDKMIQEEGLQSVIDHMNETFEEAVKKPNLEKGNVVTVLVDGKPVRVRVFDPQFLEAISNLSPKGQDYVTNAVGKATKTMKTLTTGVNPIFGLTRNVARDIPHAFNSSKSTINPLRYGVDLLDSMTSVLADSMSQSKLAPEFMKGWLEARGKLYNDYKNMGGGHSSSIAADRNLLAQNKERILPSNSLKQTLKRPFTKAYHALENVNNAAEAAPRLGEYKRFVKQGGGTYDSKIKGLYEANDVTTNFNKYGNVTKNVDAYLPYLNASVQGLDQLARTYFTGDAKRLTQVYAKSIATLTIPTIVLYLINHNDPNYQQESNFNKDNYLLIPNGDGTFTKIAKTREMGMVFSTSVERALRAFEDHDPKAFQDFGTNFLNNFLPPNPLTSNTLSPLITNIPSNKDFAGRDIIPRDLTGLSPRLQYDAKTSELAKFLGNVLNYSPKKIDYLTKSYGGILGQLGIPLTIKGGSLGDTLKQQVTTDPTFSNDISRNFYDAKAKADMQKADAKSQGEAPQDNMAAYYDRLATKFSKIRQQQKRIQNDDSLSRTEKQKQIKELQQMLNELQAGAMQ